MSAPKHHKTGEPLKDWPSASTDVVEELRGPYSTFFPRSVAKRCADEIESLRTQIAALENERSKLAAPCQIDGCHYATLASLREKVEGITRWNLVNEEEGGALWAMENHPQGEYVRIDAVLALLSKTPA